MEKIRQCYSKIKELWSCDKSIFGQEFDFGSLKILLHLPSHILIGGLAYGIGAMFGVPVIVWLAVSLTIFIGQLFWENLMKKDGKGYKGIAQNVIDFLQYGVIPLIIIICK